MSIPIFIDSSVFLKFFLEGSDEWSQSQAMNVLSKTERGVFVGYITPMVLEEVTFKLVVAVASKMLSTKNVWRIRERMLSDESFGEQVLSGISPWVNYLFLMVYLGHKGKGV